MKYGRKPLDNIIEITVAMELLETTLRTLSMKVHTV